MAEDARLQLAQGVNPMDDRKDRKKASNPDDGAFGLVALKCNRTHGVVDTLTVVANYLDELKAKA
jgi:hypothetical protein